MFLHIFQDMNYRAFLKEDSKNYICILHWYPLKIQIVPQLKSHDPQQPLDFVLQFLARMEVDDMWPENILWTDEAHFI